MASGLGIPTWENRLRERQSAANEERIIETTPAIANYPVQSPLWWVNRLFLALQERLRMLNVYDDYYCGEFPLPWLHKDAEEEFRRILRMARANYCGPIADAQAERLVIEGFRIDTGDNDDSMANLGPVVPSPQVTGAIGAAAQGKALNINIGTGPAKGGGAGSIGVSKGSRYTQTTIGEADKETWRIWQANNMDTLFDQAILEATINGVAYLMAEPNNDDPKTPKIWVEHPAQCIVEHVPGTNRRKVAAGLKVWVDDWTKKICATLYMLNTDGVLEIYKYQADVPKSREIRSRDWKPRLMADEEWPAVLDDITEVPIWELPNNPRLLTGGQSELHDLLDTQDRVVKTIADRLMNQDFGAFPQKWASGWPETDANGNPNQQIKVGQDRMVTTDVPEAKFGSFAASDPSGYIAGKKEDVLDMAARSRTPASYLLGGSNSPNGESYKAEESGLIAKCRQRMRDLDDHIESCVRFVRTLAGTAIPDDVTMEVVWRNPEFRTEGEVVDALTKMSTLGVPMQALWERWGASPPEIQRWTQMQVEYQQQQAQMDATALLADQYRKNAAGSGAGGPTGTSSAITGTEPAAGAAGGGNRNGGGTGRP